MRDNGADFFIKQTEEASKETIRYCLIGNQDKFDKNKQPILSKDSDLYS